MPGPSPLTLLPQGFGLVVSEQSAKSFVPLCRSQVEISSYPEGPFLASSAVPPSCYSGSWLDSTPCNMSMIPQFLLIQVDIKKKERIIINDRIQLINFQSSWIGKCLNSLDSIQVGLKSYHFHKPIQVGLKVYIFHMRSIHILKSQSKDQKIPSCLMRSC